MPLRPPLSNRLPRERSPSSVVTENAEELLLSKLQTKTLTLALIVMVEDENTAYRNPRSLNHDKKSEEKETLNLHSKPSPQSKKKKTTKP